MMEIIKNKSVSRNVGVCGSVCPRQVTGCHGDSYMNELRLCYIPHNTQQYALVHECVLCTV